MTEGNNSSAATEGAEWTIVEGKTITGKTLIFEGTFIIAEVTRREDAERIVALNEPQEVPETTVVAWCGWHEKHGYNFSTIAAERQSAVSLIMRTGIAGNHAWEVRPLRGEASSQLSRPQGE